MPPKTNDDDADAVLDAFISRDPKARYTFDSERNAPQSELCREGRSGDRECIIIQMNSKRLFEAMRAKNFFCALPMDPSHTYMDCTPIPDTATPSSQSQSQSQN